MPLTESAPPLSFLSTQERQQRSALGAKEKREREGLSKAGLRIISRFSAPLPRIHFGKVHNISRLRTIEDSRSDLNCSIYTNDIENEAKMLNSVDPAQCIAAKKADSIFPVRKERGTEISLRGRPIARITAYLPLSFEVDSFPPPSLVFCVKPGTIYKSRRRSILFFYVRRLPFFLVRPLAQSILLRPTQLRSAFIHGGHFPCSHTLKSSVTLLLLPPPPPPQPGNIFVV